MPRLEALTDSIRLGLVLSSRGRVGVKQKSVRVLMADSCSWCRAVRGLASRASTVLVVRLTIVSRCRTWW